MPAPTHHAPFRPHRTLITGDQAQLYDLLLDGILGCKDRVPLPRGTTGTQVQDLLERIRQENPLALFEEARVMRSGFGLSWGNPVLTLTYRPDVAELQAKAARAAREVLRQCGGTVAGEAALALRFHDHLASHCRYEPDAPLAHEAPGALMHREVLRQCGGTVAGEAALALRFHDHLASHCRYEPDAPLAHEAPGALMHGAAVCDGIAKAYKLLCDEAGIPCTVVTGSSGGPHAWNVVRVEGRWAHVDVTDDLASPGGQRPVSRAFFGLSDQEVLRERAIKSGHPPCPNNLGFYRSLGLHAETPAGLASLCYRRFARGEHDFEVELSADLIDALDNDGLLKTVGSALLQAGRSGRVQLSARRTGVVRVVV